MPCLRPPYSFILPFLKILLSQSLLKSWLSPNFLEWGIKKQENCYSCFLSSAWDRFRSNFIWTNPTNNQCPQEASGIQSHPFLSHLSSASPQAGLHISLWTTVLQFWSLQMPSGLCRCCIFPVFHLACFFEYFFSPVRPLAQSKSGLTRGRKSGTCWLPLGLFA